MSGHHDKIGRLMQRRQLQSAQSTFRRFGAALDESRKGTWSPRQVIREHRDEVQAAIDEIAPIFEGRLSDAVAYDRECAEIAKAAAARPAYSNAPGARIGSSASSSGDESLEAFRARVQFAVDTAGTPEVARERLATIIATTQVKSIFRGSK